MAKFRVVMEDGKYYPQHKFLWWWFNYDAYNPTWDKHFTVRFTNKHDAIDFVMSKTRFGQVAKKEMNVVYRYEE